MFLKRLETVGFKSFAERIQMEFVPGVTAVVGPNGSGKSNIIDAMRWVLGEQSAKSLRGQKMEDIIFQGSDSRKALNFAEVAMIINNETGRLPIDYQEVNVTRRVYRSGESEFFINKQACRLKDIVDLFMDTGLGRESFSIIGQGRIDEILSSKAEERRAVFEEAAGVLKYKKRKNKAEFKLLETSDNLDRVEDIIHEIDQQIEPLQEQAKVAKQYKVFKNELKETEVALLATEIEQLHSEWQAILNKLDEDKLTEIEKQTIIQDKEARITKERNKAQQLDQEITDLQNNLLSITEQLEQYEGRRNVLEERSKHMKENKQKLQQEKSAYQHKLEQLDQYIHQEKQQLSDITSSIEGITNDISIIENKLMHGTDRVNEKIEDLKSDYIEYLNEQAVLQNEAQTIEKQLKQISIKENLQLNKYQDSIKEENRLKTKKSELEDKLSALEENMKQGEANRLQIKESIENERSNYESMQQKLFEGNEQIAKLTSRKEMLEEMRESYQGFFYGVKEILKAKKQNQLKEIIGAVIDLIEVPNSYITAIDTVLGAQAQYVVVPDDQTARYTIQWLKEKNKGRATFLPLQSIEPRKIPSNILEMVKKEQGFLGIASELITVKGKYERVADYLLGNVIITNDLKSANAVAKITNRKYRITTLDGDMVYPGGSMSGGAKKKNNQTLFTREKEITDLTAKLAEFSSRAAKYHEKVKHQKNQFVMLEQKLTKEAKQIDFYKQAMDKTQTTFQEIVMDYRRKTDQLSSFRSDSEQQKAEQIKLELAYERIIGKQKSIKDSIFNTEKSIDQLTEEKNLFETNEKQTEKQLHDFEIKKAEHEERKKSRQEQLQGFEIQYSELAGQLKDINEQMAEMMDEQERAELKKELAEKLDHLKESKQKATDKLSDKRSERAYIVQQTDDEEKEIRGLYHTLEAFKKEIQQKEVQANRLDVALENRLTTLQDEYRTTFERANEQYEQVEDTESAKDKVKELKTAIDRLGTVNLGAIDEYERLSERYQFLQEQQKDLLEAKQTLYEIIREMDEEMTRRFSSVFGDIQNAFTDVFKKLFGGGHAALSLTDPTKLLETGIDIIARPPGKKMKTLGLLSGGERALTAIALLFAILRVRPVPFCILDEVDAALDEANVDRFGSYLRSFSEETQFIVITHRKGTMEEADALYGITMQESGVSRLVSVKLEETNRLVGTI